MVANQKSPRPYRVFWKDDNGVVHMGKRAYKKKASAFIEMCRMSLFNEEQNMIGIEEIYDFWVGIAPTRGHKA